MGGDQAGRDARVPAVACEGGRGAGGALRGNDDLAAAASVLSSLPGWLSSSVTEISAPEPGQVTVRLSDNVTIVWGSNGRNQQKSQELRILMKQAPAKYYDVSAEGTVVTK